LLRLSLLKYKIIDLSRKRKSHFPDSFARKWLFVFSGVYYKVIEFSFNLFFDFSTLFLSYFLLTKQPQ